MTDNSPTAAFDRIVAYVLDTMEDSGLEWVEMRPWWWDEDVAIVRAALKVASYEDADSQAAVQSARTRIFDQVTRAIEDFEAEVRRATSAAIAKAQS